MKAYKQTVIPEIKANSVVFKNQTRAKAMVLVKLLEAMKYATLNNFGLRKEKDGPSVLGYLNYKVKVRIDGEIKNFRISCILKSDGKVFYNHEMNKPPRTKILKP